MSSRYDPGLVSVILPLYKVYRYVGEAIDSLKAQTYTHFECLCLDDGSGNEMTAVVRAKIADDPRFRLYEFENAGMAEGRNRGLNLANGEYVTFLDQDDGFHPRFLEEMVGALEKYKADCAVCMFKNIGQDVKIADCSAGDCLQVDWKPIDTPSIYFMDVSDRDIYNVWQKVFRRSSLGGLRFRKNLFGADDACFSLEAFLRFQRIVYTDAQLHFYRQHDESVTSQKVSRYTFSKLNLVTELAPLIPEYQRRFFRKFALLQLKRAVKDAVRCSCDKQVRRELAEATRDALHRAGLHVWMWSIGAQLRYLKLWLSSF